MASKQKKNERNNGKEVMFSCRNLKKPYRVWEIAEKGMDSNMK